jgi:hypothetical protein
MEQNKSSAPRLILNSRKQRPSYPATAGDIANVHAFYLGEVCEECHPATPHRYTVQACQEEAYTGGEDCIQCQTVALLGRVFRRQDAVELTDQRAHIVGGI